MSMIPTNAKPKTKMKYEQVTNGIYPARLVRIVGYGMQKQPEWNNEAKPDAFKVALTFELYNPNTGAPLDVAGYEVVMKDDVETKVDGTDVTRPSCVFQDMFFFPGAKRGKVFDLANALEAGIDKVPQDFDWFVEKLGTPLQVNVEGWTSKAGNTGISVVGVAGLPVMTANALAAPRTDLVSFFPYTESDLNDRGYAKMYPFQRTILTEASDSANIPYAGKEPKKFDDEAPKAPEEAKQGVATPANAPEVDFDDDIPF